MVDRDPKPQPVQVEKTPKPAAAIEALLADTTQKVSEAQIAVLTAEIVHVQEAAKLDELKDWANAELTAVGTRISMLEGQKAIVLPEIATTIDELIALSQEREKVLRELLTVADRQVMELRFREPFTTNELVDGLKTALEQGGMETLEVALGKLRLLIRSEILAEIAAKTPAVQTPEPVAAAPVAAAAEPVTESVTGPGDATADATIAAPETTVTAPATVEAVSTPAPETESAADKEYTDMVARLKKFTTDHPDDALSEQIASWLNLTKLSTFGGRFRPRRFFLGQLKRLDAKAQKITAGAEQVVKFKQVVDVLKATRVDKILLILNEAPRGKDKKIDVVKLKAQNEDMYYSLAAQLLFMAEQLRLIKTPTWISATDKPTAIARGAGIREFANANHALVEEYYGRKEVIDQLKTAFPDVIIEAPAAPSTVVAPATRVEATPTAAAAAPAAPETPPATRPRPADAAPAPRPEATAKKPMTAEELRVAMGISQEDFNNAEDNDLVAMSRLQRLISSGRSFDTLDSETIKKLAVILKANKPTNLAQLEEYVTKKS